MTSPEQSGSPLEKFLQRMGSSTPPEEKPGAKPSEFVETSETLDESTPETILTSPFELGCRLHRTLYEHVLGVAGKVPNSPARKELFDEALCWQERMQSALRECWNEWLQALRCFVRLTMYWPDPSLASEQFKEALAAKLISRLGLDSPARNFSATDPLEPRTLNEQLSKEPYRSIRERIADHIWECSVMTSREIIVVLRRCVESKLLGLAELYSATGVGRLEVIHRRLGSTDRLDSIDSSSSQSVCLDLVNIQLSELRCAQEERGLFEGSLTETSFERLAAVLPCWLLPDVRILSGTLRREPSPMLPGMTGSPFVVLGPYVLMRADGLPPKNVSKPSSPPLGWWGRLRSWMEGENS